MSTTRLRDRIFAGFGAALFLITSLAFTAYAVVQTGGNTQTDTNTNSTAQNDTCGTSQPVTTVTAKPEVKTYPEGVQTLKTEDIVVGTGAEAKLGDCIQVQYYGTLAKDGTVFQENFSSTNAAEFSLATGGLIKGWTEGIPGMKEGGQRRLVIPAEKAYGSQEQEGIPANSDLVFVVKLVKIK